MGKKNRLFMEIRRVLTCSSSINSGIDSERKDVRRNKRKVLQKRHGKGKKFITLFREPSSIEKILGDAERENHQVIYKPPSPLEREKASPLASRDTSPLCGSPKVASPRVPSLCISSPGVESPRIPPHGAITFEEATSPRITSPNATSPRDASPKYTLPRVSSPRAVSPRTTSGSIIVQKKIHHHEDISQKLEPTLGEQNASAIKIQKVYRGHMFRRRFRGLRSTVRLEEVVKGQHVKRQISSATKRMQLFVRVQSQIQSQQARILESPTLQHLTDYNDDKEVESAYGKGSHTSEAGINEDWDESVITKEERDARTRRKMEAIINRERAMAFAYPHQLQKIAPTSAPSALMDRLSGEAPWRWNWVDRRLPLSVSSDSQAFTTPRSSLDRKQSLRSHLRNSDQRSCEFDSFDAMTPKSTRSSTSPRKKRARTPTRFSQEQMPNSSGTLQVRGFKPRPSGGDSPFSVGIRDDDSLRSCPPFSVPRYMAPTVSASAKMRTSLSPKDRSVGTPRGSECGRRLSFPSSPASTASSYKWTKGHFQKNQSPKSIDNRSVNSAVSLPVGVGRKPFNRFV